MQGSHFMKYPLILVSLLLSFFLVLSGCDRDKKTDEPSTSLAVMKLQWSPKPIASSAQIKIINQYGEAVKGAQILIGEAQGTPFRDNFITTDSSGIAIVPTDWTTPASVTVDAKSYIRQTLLNVKPGNIILKLNAAYLAQRAEVRGQITQLPIVNGDKLIDFGLAMSALSKSDLLNFDLGQIISPYSDTLSAAGQNYDIPSNVALPSQTESFLINITLNKPVYRLKIPTLGPKKFVSARGRFVFKDVVKELRDGKPFYELINKFSILGGSLRETTLVSNLTNLDIPGNELLFNSVINVKPVATLADETLIVLATSELSGTMIPTDVKKAVNGQNLNLQSLPGSSVFIINVVKKQAEFMSDKPGSDRMSASLLPYSTNSSQKLLPLIANPSIINSGNYVINLPNIPNTDGIYPIATSAAISDLIETKEGNKTIYIPVRKWEVLGLNWSAKINLPQWPLDNSNSRKRIEVNYIGSSTHQSANLDDSLIENATHVTHASTDF